MRSLIFAALLIGQNVDGPRSWPGPIFVTEGDVLTCPYHVVGRIDANVHATTIFGSKPSPDRVVREIRERAVKLGADAVVKVTISAEHSTAVWGRVVTGSGDAIRFVDAKCWSSARDNVPEAGTK